MAKIDEIRLGPIHLELHEFSSGPSTRCIVATEARTSGSGLVGTPVTLEEWRKAKRFVGLEGMMGDDLPRPETPSPMTSQS